MARLRQIEDVIVVADHALGSIRVADDGSVLGLDLGVGVLAALSALRAANVRVGLAVLDRTLRLPEDDFAGLPGGISARAVEGAPEAWLPGSLRKVGGNPESTVLVSADVTVRNAAHSLGCQVAPHAAAAVWLVSGRQPCFVKLEGAREALSRHADLLPYYAVPSPRGLSLLAALPSDAVGPLAGDGVAVESLRLDPSLFDPYLVRVDPRRTDRTRIGRHEILWSEGSVLLIAVSPSDLVALERLASRHGALQLLTPSPSLLVKGGQGGERLRAPPPARRTPPRPPAIEPAGSGGFAGPTAAGVLADVARYSGASPFDAAGPIRSRHPRHPDASRAVLGLMADLTQMGYTPFTHTFVNGGKTLANVIADLPGVGTHPFSEPAIDRLRAAARDLATSGQLTQELTESFGADWVRSEGLEGLSGAPLVQATEARLGLGGWSPWWRQTQPLQGFGAELLIVGSHLDSTAASTPGYDPATSSAPGADDNGSGIACTLAIAREIAKYRGLLTHTVRFCFFNAEEQGLVGSGAYAAHLKAAMAPVKGVVCIDMAGYDVVGGRTFEIHAGAHDPAVRDASVVLASSVAKWAAETTALAPAQIYRGTTTVGGNRDVWDPAIGRADHSSFQNQGYGAIVISEDFFANEPGEGAPEPNPNYHRETDTSVNGAYTADIARAVLSAIIDLAR